MTVNLNQFFRRLSIRTKLLIAFGLLAIAPVLFFTTTGTVITYRVLRDRAVQDLASEVEVARLRTARSLSDLDTHTAYLSRSVARPALVSNALSLEQAADLTAGFLAADSSSLFRVQVLNAEGDVLLLAEQGREARIAPDVPRQLLYAYALRAMTPEERSMRPVELRSEDGIGRVPAVAVLAPLFDPEGRQIGGVVGEARAATLFEALEGIDRSRPGVRTGLVDVEGLYLFESTRKRDWVSLVDPDPDATLQGELGVRIAHSVTSGFPGATDTEAGDLISFTPLSGPAESTSRFFLYRIESQASIVAPFRGLIMVTSLGGVLLVLAVSGAALLAAQQFTRPILEIRGAARLLMTDGVKTPLDVSTNDELEDLARDFSAMSETLIDQRGQLEELLAKRTESLRTHEAELAEILSNAADAIIGLDPDGRVRVWNAGAEALFGYEAQEVEGRRLTDVLERDTRPWQQERAYLGRQLERTGRIVGFRTRRLHRNGEEIPVSVTQTRVTSAAGVEVGSSLIIRDARPERILEEQMGRSERLAAVSVMAAGLAHEIRNPLAVVANRIEIMQREARGGNTEPATIHRDLGLLHEHVDRLKALTQDLLRFARDEGEDARPVDLTQVVSRVVGLLERTLAGRRLAVHVQADMDLPPVPVIEAAVETMLVNLILNAADASPDGGGITVETRLADSGTEAEIHVVDEGDGIPEELRSRIWEPFFTTKGGAGGTGLGLAVCRSIMERHRGRIRVEPVPGGGSRFITSFPLSP
jgi:PAS domain S-box-containing protein